MGQPVTVIERPSSRGGIVRYELNRVLTGMGHERYQPDDVIVGDRPPDELARRLFEHGGIDHIHMNGSVVTLDVSKGGSTEGIKEIIEDLYTYYRPGVEVPSFPEPEAPAEERSGLPSIEHVFDTGEVNEQPGLAALAEQLRPTLLRAEQRVEIGDELASLFPLGGPARGSSISVEGDGATSVVMSLIATPTRMGAWVAVVGVDQWGWSAAVAAGVALCRTVAVRQPGAERWGAVFGALVGAFGIVVLDASRPVSAADARRLDARCRENGTLVIRLAPPSRRHRWPSSADVALMLSDASWSGIDDGHGHLDTRTVTVRVGGRRRGAERHATLRLPASGTAAELVAESPTSTPTSPRLRRVV